MPPKEPDFPDRDDLPKESARTILFQFVIFPLGIVVIALGPIPFREPRVGPLDVPLAADRTWVLGSLRDSPAVCAGADGRAARTATPSAATRSGPIRSCLATG